VAAAVDDDAKALAGARAAWADGRVVLSEHVVRSLMSGTVHLADMDAALHKGTVIEVRAHPQRGISRLLAVLSHGRAVHVVLGQSADGWLVVPFAYVPAQPVWATPGRRNPKGGEFMSEGLSSCYFCGGGIKTVTVGNFDYRKEGKLYVIKKVPAGLCLECGEKYISPEVGRRMDEMIAAEAFTGSEMVNVFDFAAS
jgi:YgiT-type zinc finger domain-containing protein